MAFQHIHEQWSIICALSMATKCINQQQLSLITHKTTTNRNLLDFWIVGVSSRFQLFSNSSKKSPNLAKVSWIIVVIEKDMKELGFGVMKIG